MKAVMKVSELMVRLAIADPEDIVVIETDSHCLFVLNPGSGMFQPLYLLDEAPALTERDKEFLCSLRVRF
ncbi:MAG: hypothetical protein WBP79_04155 [Candidatus Acidiferrales bacterium]